MNRREFLQQTGRAGSGAVAGLLSGNAGSWEGVTGKRASAAPGERGVSIILDPTDPLASGPPVRWASEQVRKALEARGIPVRSCERLGEAPPGDILLLAAGVRTLPARAVVEAAGLSIPEA